MLVSVAVKQFWDMINTRLDEETTVVYKFDNSISNVLFGRHSLSCEISFSANQENKAARPWCE